MRRLAALWRAPVLITQAIGVMRRAQRLPEAAGDRQGQTGNGPELRLLIIGDSSAAGVGVDHQDAALIGQILHHLAPHFTVDWQLRARSGATTAGMLRALQSAPPGPANVVIVVLGVNDVTRMVRPDTWLRRQRRLCALVARHARPDAIYLTGLPPMEIYPLLPDPLRQVLGARAARFEALRKGALQDDPLLHHVVLPGPFDPALMAQDGYHPAAPAYAIWGAQLATRIIADRQPQ